MERDPLRLVWRAAPGLTVALELGSPAIALVCVAALVLALVLKRPRPAGPGPAAVG